MTFIAALPLFVAPEMAIASGLQPKAAHGALIEAYSRALKVAWLMASMPRTDAGHAALSDPTAALPAGQS